MHEGKQLRVRIGCKSRFDLGRIHRCAPGILDDHRHTADAPHVLGHALAKHAIDANDNLVTRRHKVHETGFHAQRTRPRHRKSQLIAGLEGIAEQGLDFIHHADEGRIKVADGRPGQRRKHPRRHIGRPRPHQGTHGRLEGSDRGSFNGHGCLLFFS